MESTSDLSVYSNYLPYTYNNISDNTLPEDVITDDNPRKIEDRDDTTHSEYNVDAAPTESEDADNQPIETVVGNRNEGWKESHHIPAKWRTETNNITVRQDNRELLASKLPALFVTNHQSFFPKFWNFIDLMQTHGLTLGLFSEIWEFVF